jgi:hypothetical protein
MLGLCPKGLCPSWKLLGAWLPPLAVAILCPPPPPVFLRAFEMRCFARARHERQWTSTVTGQTDWCWPRRRLPPKGLADYGARPPPEATDHGEIRRLLSETLLKFDPATLRAASPSHFPSYGRDTSALSHAPHIPTRRPRLDILAARKWRT